MPGGGEWWIFVAIGVIAAAALYAMTTAFTVGAPSLVAPFEYTGIAWAGLFGWLFWGEVPSGIVTVGASALVLCGFPGARHDDQVDALSQLLAWTWERRPRLTVGPLLGHF